MSSRFEYRLSSWKVLALACCALALVCGAAWGAGSDDRWMGPSDERLTKSVGLEARRTKISDVLDALSKQTGVTLIAGYNKSDWQVRDRKVIIFAKDIPAANLMNSIAHVTKLKWKREMSGDIASYRLLTDKKALSDAEEKRLRDQKHLEERRGAALDAIADAADASPEEIAQMRQERPLLAVFASTGLANGLSGLMRDVPGLGEALSTGQSVSLGFGDLSPQGQAALQALLNSFLRLGSQVSKTQIEIPKGFDWGRSVVNVNDGANGSMLGNLHFVNNMDFDLGLADPDGAAAGIVGRQLLQAMDGSQPQEALLKGDDSFQGMAEAKAKDDAMIDPGEPAAEHPDEPALHAKVTLKPKGRCLSDVLAALSESAGLCVVSDSFGKNEESVNNAEVELKDALEAIGKAYDSNWDKKAMTVEFMSRHWYRKLAVLIPDAVIEPWRQAANKSGTLSIEELSRIASLTIEQMAMNVSGDDVLANKTLVTTTMLNQDVLRVYSALNSRQRKMLFSKSGLSLADITPSQWPMVQVMIQRRNGALLDDPNARVAFVGTSTAQQGKQIRYTITLASTNADTRPTVWTILTPRYETPEKK